MDYPAYEAENFGNVPPYHFCKNCKEEIHNNPETDYCCRQCWDKAGGY